MARWYGKRLRIINLSFIIVAVFYRISTRNKKKWKLRSIYPIVIVRKEHFRLPVFMESDQLPVKVSLRPDFFCCLFSGYV